MWFFEPMPQAELIVTGVPWPYIPFYNQYHDGNAIYNSEYPYLSTNVAKKFMLCRSLFDLVNSSYCLDLDDKRLLTWYCNLSNEERDIIREEGGLYQFLLRHPALDVAKKIKTVHVKPQIRRAGVEMSSQLNKSRMPTFYGVSQCKKCGTSCPSGSETCRPCFVPPPVVEERMHLPGPKREPAAIQYVPGNRGFGVWGGNIHSAPGDQVSQDSFQSALDNSHASLASADPRGSTGSQAQHLFKERREGRSSAAVSTSRDTSAQASFSLDVELERHRSQMAQGASPPAYPVHQAEFWTSSVTDNRSYMDLAQEQPPEYYSFNSTRFDQTSAEWMANGSQSAEQASVDSFVAAGGSTENSRTTSSAGLFPSEVSVSCHSCPSECSSLNATADESLRLEPRDEFHSVMEESVNPEPWLICSSPGEKPHVSPYQKPHVDLHVKLGVGKGQQTPRKEEQSVAASFIPVSPDKSGVKLPVSAAPRPTTVTQAVDASGDFRACFTSTKECEAAPSTTDASTEMDSPMCLEQDTQTIQPSTAEKSVITEVYIADLDYLTKEFLRLKSVEEELELLKANQLKPNRKCGCESGQRLKHAELKLLALQYAMCQEHCWRRYYTSGHVEESKLHCAGEVPGSLAETLHALDQDYNQMRRQVLSGAALDELTPLSVDTHRLNTEARYTPAQKMNGCLEDEVPLESTGASQVLQKETDTEMGSLGVDKAERPGRNITSKKGALGQPGVSLTQSGGVKSSKVVSVKTHKSDSSHGSYRPGGPKERGNVEAWYDAEEDLGPAGRGLKEERLRKVIEMGDDNDDDDGRKMSFSCLLSIADLPDDVTEDDLLLVFEKYHPREVCFTMSSKSRTASVTVSSPEDAEAAVQDLRGTIVHGQSIQVRRAGTLPAAGPEGDHAFKKPDTPRPAPSGDVPKLGSVKKSPPYNMSPKPLRCRIEKLVNVSDVPTATGTYVPQQPPANTTTMGSFDTLMARLSERHPELGRQKILEALLELRAQHRGFLSGLPLRTIVEMTTELLTTQASGSK
ncbi:RNA-binding protein 44 isoform X3 [Clupea harengus]|uniref:RNA-binding protein 44 isoform X3 n=1 Tax=Clupea harengus TaxID=7950 RepID=A0A6P8GT16_CLUHA|nr:RNA-binding protein 44 isoform X3 [Clupea harengus]